MKKILLLLLCVVSFTIKAQSFSHTPKTISTIPTDSLSQEVKIKNPYKEPVVIICYRFRAGDQYWEEIGSVTVFPNMQAKFFMKKGFVYGGAEENFAPKRFGPIAKKYKVKKRDYDYDQR
jgi:hypothetical protein